MQCMWAQLLPGTGFQRNPAHSRGHSCLAPASQTPSWDLSMGHSQHRTAQGTRHQQRGPSHPSLLFRQQQDIPLCGITQSISLGAKRLQPVRAWSGRPKFGCHLPGSESAGKLSLTHREKAFSPGSTISLSEFSSWVKSTRMIPTPTTHQNFSIIEYTRHTQFDQHQPAKRGCNVKHLDRRNHTFSKI